MEQEAGAEAVEKDLLSWSKDHLHLWQRNVLKRVVLGMPIDDSYVENLVNNLLEDNVELELPELTLQDFPTGEDSESSAKLCSISSLKNVNALCGDQSLTFTPEGMTIVYGDNGCGKSGYARLLKDTVGSRKKTEILPNIYSGGSEEQRAIISYIKNGEECTTEWPNGDYQPLRHVHFYDEDCGDDYLESSSELTYRPLIFNYFDELISVIDRVRDELNRKIAKNTEKELLTIEVPDGTAAAAFMNSLSSETTQEEIDQATSAPSDAQQQLANLTSEISRLAATSPEKEVRRLEEGAKSVDLLADHFDDISAVLSPAAVQDLMDSKEELSELRNAAESISGESFASEPLQGVGSKSWRLMWAAAEEYSKTMAYPGIDYPAIGPEHYCVLCQQSIGIDAKDRLDRFNRFVHNKLETQVNDKEQAYNKSFQKLKQFEIVTVDITNAVTFLTKEDKSFGDSVAEALSLSEDAKGEAIARLNGESSEERISLTDFHQVELRELAKSLRNRRDSVDAAGFKRKIEEISGEKNELEALIIISNSKKQIKSEADRLSELSRLKSVLGRVSTGVVTKESAELQRKYVNEVVKDYFGRKARGLQLEHIVLQDKGGHKGKVRHQPALTGTGQDPKKVLSEGEQTAAGLVGFLTEIYFDNTKSAVVLDDPVSSLDHGRRRKVASLIAELAIDRQIIVFTHDLVFVGQLQQAAHDNNVPFTERSIERNRLKQPGIVNDKYPWKAKSVDGRIRVLSEELNMLKSSQASMDSDRYETEVASWAGKLSETWERMIRSDILAKVNEPGTPQVHPVMLKVVARVTREDNDDFQKGYSKTSLWARRHDKDPDENYVVPEIDDLQKEFDRIQAWHQRIKRYASK
jgi:energy-coupling factor transporter ATP-binding protein EcfA2